MCGIIGMFAFSKGSTAEENILRRESMLYLFTEILERTRTRGPDATGVSALFSDGNSIIQKGNVKSSEFISNFGGEDDKYDGFINTCKASDAELNILMGHCRKSSVGNTWDNENNHPIKAGEIIGVHNGTLKNHEIIFNKLDCDRDGEVDSEAIMRLLQYLTNDCEDPFTLETLWETYRRLEGAFTTISYNANNPYQVALMRKERPMEIAIINSLKLLVVVSEKIFLEEALFDYNKQAMLYGRNFELIKDDDVDFMTLALDNIAVVDLTRKINADTKITDLLDKKDAFKSSKLWRTPAIGTNQTWQNKKNTTNNTTKSSTLNETSTKKDTGSSSDKSKDNFPGKVFCKDLNTYVDPNTAETLAEKGPLLFENPAGKITPLEKPEEVKKVLTKVDEVNIENLETAVEIVEESKIKKLTNKVEVIEPFTNPEVLKAAKIEVNGLTRYETTSELAKALDAASSETIEALEPYALANRVKVAIYEEAFIDGATFFNKLHQSDAAQKAVRIAKHVVEVFGKVIDELSDKKTTSYKQKLITHITNTTSELTKSNIKQVFSKGNLMKNQALTTLEEVADD